MKFLLLRFVGSPNMFFYALVCVKLWLLRLVGFSLIRFLLIGFYKNGVFCSSGFLYHSSSLDLFVPAIHSFLFQFRSGQIGSYVDCYFGSGLLSALDPIPVECVIECISVQGYASRRE